MDKKTSNRPSCDDNLMVSNRDEAEKPGGHEEEQPGNIKPEQEQREIRSDHIHPSSKCQGQLQNINYTHRHTQCATA